MIGPLQSFILKVGAALRSRWYWRVVCYALIVAAIFAVWLLMDGNGVAFVYSEF